MKYLEQEKNTIEMVQWSMDEIGIILNRKEEEEHDINDETDESKTKKLDNVS